MTTLKSVLNWPLRSRGGPILSRYVIVGFILGSLMAGEPEPHAFVIEKRIQETSRALWAKEPTARLIAVWDFDGTLLKGDCSEGLREGDRWIYPGLAQLSAERGLSSHYAGDGGFDRLWRDYQYLDEKVGHWLAYPYLVQAMAGAPEGEVRRLARETFENVYRPHLFASSEYLFRTLKESGVENIVISASAEVYVDGAAGILGVSEESLHGIRVRVNGGKMTRELLYPVTYAEGKREWLIALANQSKDRPVYVIAAFGNSYNTDGAFLRYVAESTLPVGETTAVMINGGTPPSDAPVRLVRVEQRNTVGPVVK